ncbi:hypothetical protein ACO22_04062 [Paracoccidioides brasiliensis]|uniref:Potassium transport protein n=1 Tax=Paracoccidioides brasiliensis TaxID=121759 RepID=A0A1D2JE72_PARBR|nr:hypothetical protein ACO22_04062 [Paracoccidioides brasiliensis]ODH51640.1 hypothetical protein GX48_02105 [Paracoccidioides brasiliensis]
MSPQFGFKKAVARAYCNSIDALSTTLKVLGTIKSRIPIISSIRINFISIHYAYIISCSIACSVVLFSIGNMSYIDALLFGAGASTQSGLNPIDVNLLFTYQQVGIYFTSMITNPIVINTAVVFIRLFWFEKRFQHVVREAKTLRRSKSRSRTMTREVGEQGDRDHNREEMGVRGRHIVLVRNSDTGQPRTQFTVPDIVEKSSPESTSESDVSPTINPDSVTNGDGISQNAAGTTQNRGSESNVKRPTAPDATDEDGNLRAPPHLSPEHHIAFLEHQRRETGALRIPSPREYDRGGVPQSIDDDIDGADLKPTHTSQSEQPSNPAQLSQFQQQLQSSPGQHITIDEPDVVRVRSRTATLPRISSRYGPSTATAGPDENLPKPTRRGTLTSIFRSTSAQDADIDSSPYLSWQPTIGRNSAFVDLTEAQRDELGGIEYRALKALAVLLIGYFFFFHLLGVVCLVPWIMQQTRFGDIVKAAGQGRPWWAIFTAGSSFNDQGFALTPDSMISFFDAIFPLLLMAFLIIVGNTGFPCMLRFIIWVFSHLVPHGGPLWEELRFLLDHPRRCFTLLFPRAATWWLFGFLVLLNVVDVIFFVILYLNNSEISKIPGGIRFVDGLFQAAATRTAGLSVVNLAEVHPAVQVSYMIMMYISVFPIAISVRRTNVYEEGSLGIYSSPYVDKDDGDEAFEAKEFNYVGAHLRRQLSFDLWFIFLGLFIIAIVEAGRLDNTGEGSLSMFAILFEIVSAYGTVGLSLGYPGTNTSLCAQFKPLSKLIIIAMEIRGRHRGLPYELDRAILLPSESLQRRELVDANKRSKRPGSQVSVHSGVTGQGQPQTTNPQQDIGSSSGYQRDGPHGSRWSEANSLAPTGAVTMTPRLATHHEIA